MPFLISSLLTLDNDAAQIAGICIIHVLKKSRCSLSTDKFAGVNKEKFVITSVMPLTDLFRLLSISSQKAMEIVKWPGIQGFILPDSECYEFPWLLHHPPPAHWETATALPVADSSTCWSSGELCGECFCPLVSCVPLTPQHEDILSIFFGISKTRP